MCIIHISDGCCCCCCVCCCCYHRKDSAVLCRFVSLPMGVTVKLRALDPNSFFAAADAAGGLQVT